MCKVFKKKIYRVFVLESFILGNRNPCTELVLERIFFLPILKQSVLVQLYFFEYVFKLLLCRL